VLATGSGIITHTPSKTAAKNKHNRISNFSVIETHLMPYFSHSHTFEIEDTAREIEGAYVAQIVRHELGGKKNRTYISYREDKKIRA